MQLTEQVVLQTLMQWRTRVSAAAWIVVRNTHTAEDIFQNVVIKAMTREVSFESEGALLSWALITARREGIDWLSRRDREVVALDPVLLQLLDQHLLTRAASQVGSRIDLLQDCLESTPTDSRKLLRMRYHENLSCEEVAQKLGLGLNAVYKRLSRLHESLKLCIEGKTTLADGVGGLAK